MDIIPGIAAASSALDAQRLRLEVVAQNIANAQTTRGPDGLPYARRVVSFEAQLVHAEGGAPVRSVRVAEVAKDPRPGPVVHLPGHPDADAQGYVRLPNVDLAMEMTDLVSASRAYEANLAVVRVGREMTQRTLEIGR